MDDTIARMKAERERLEKERERLSARIEGINVRIDELDTALRVLQRYQGGADASPNGDSHDEQSSTGDQTKTDVIREILKASGSNGIKQADVRRVAAEKYGVEINANTTTVTLSRLKKIGQAKLKGRLWFYADKSEDAETDSDHETTSDTSDEDDVEAA